MHPIIVQSCSYTTASVTETAFALRSSHAVLLTCLGKTLSRSSALVPMRPCFSSASQLHISRWHQLYNTKANSVCALPSPVWVSVGKTFVCFISWLIRMRTARRSMCIGKTPNPNPSQSGFLSRPVRPWTTWVSWPVRCSSRSKSSTGASTLPPYLAASTSLWWDSLMAPCSALLSTSALERWVSSGRERKW